MKIILASGSPRRKSLLESIGLDFTVYHPDVNEEHLPGESPAELCRRLSRLKAEAGSRVYPDDAVIAADTIVVADGGEILGKPSGHDDAVRMLRLLSGRVHEVVTGLCVSCGERVSIADVHTLVKFRELSELEIEAYTQTCEPYDKAGGYAVQGIGSLMIEGIKGDYYNVVGLPLCTLGRMLAGYGVSLI
ncbi:MAG: septum formation protein Maf [Synergistaceae bacterium]|nr:septum formation protein Maf [Synergistaceae bacterium]